MRADDIEDNEAPLLSVVMPCLNAATTIAEQLEALAAQTWSRPWELVISENGSRDGTLELLESYRERFCCLRVVDSSDRQGFAHAYNAGVAAARGRLLAFCDADDVVGENWLPALGEALMRHEMVSAAVETTLLNPPWLQGVREAPAGGLPVAWHPPFLPYVSSGLLGIRKATFQRLGGFDETLPALADVDFSFRAQAHGVELRYVPEAVLHYRLRNTARAIFRQAVWYSRSSAILQERYREGARPFYYPLYWLFAKWKPLVLLTPELVTRKGRAKAAWLLGWQIGRFRGSIEQRVLAL